MMRLSGFANVYLSGIVLSVILCLAVVSTSSVYAAQLTENVTFSVTGQNLWGSGAAQTINKRFNLFEIPCDFGPYSDRNTQTLLNQEYGYDIHVQSTGNIGLFFDVDASDGGVDVDYGGSVKIDYPDPSTFRKGQELTIKTSMTESLRYIKTSAHRLDSDLFIKGSIALNTHMQVIFADNTTDILNLNVDSDNYTDPDSPFYPEFGYSLMHLDSESSPPVVEMFFPQLTIDGIQETESFELPGAPPETFTGLTGISGWLDVPKLVIDSDLTSDGNWMKASGEYTFTKLSMDLDSYLPIPPPYNFALSGGISGSVLGIVDYSAGYDVLNLELGFDVTEKQELAIDPSVSIKMDFTSALDGSSVDVQICVTERGATSTGCAWDTTNSKTFTIGKDLHVIYPDDPSPDSITVTPSLTVQSNFRNKTWLHFEEPLTFELLQAHLELSSFQLVPQLCIPAVVIEVCDWLEWSCLTGGGCDCWNVTLTPQVCTPAIKFDGVKHELGPLWEHTLTSELQKQDLTVFEETWQLGGFISQATTPFDMVTGACPTAYDGSIIFTEDIAGSGTLVSSDVIGNLKTFSIVGQGNKGTVVLDDTTAGTFTYTPAANAEGADSFTFKLHDNNLLLDCDSNVATLTVNITPVNDIPTDIALSANKVLEGVASGTLIGTLSTADSDAGDSFGYLLTDNAGGRFKIVGDQLQVDNGVLLTYAAASQHAIEIQVTDSGGETFVKGLTVLITTRPVASSAAQATNEDSALNGTFIVSDPDGDSRSYSLVTAAQKGTVVINNGTGGYSYTPFENINGTDSFTFKAIDANGLASNTATITITINPINDLPTDLSIIPAIQETIETKLSASNGASSDQMGNAVAVSGNYVVVGAAHADRAGKTNSGAAYVYEYNTDGSITEHELLLNDPNAEAYFGYSVDIFGDTAIVGAYNVSSLTGCGLFWGFPCKYGSAYIFTRNPLSGAWSQTQKLLASDKEETDKFGFSVAISGAYAIVGAPLAGAPFPWLDQDQGRAYIYEYSAGFWQESKILNAAEHNGYDNFGYSVAISGGKAVVGAPYKDEDFFWAWDSGGAYVFDKESGWGQTLQLTASDGMPYDYFGYSVGISDGLVVVGAYGNDDKGGDSGSVYYTKINPDLSGSVQITEKIFADDIATGDAFGKTLAVNGTQILVGAPGDDDRGNNSGSGYLFERLDDGTLEQLQKIVPSDGAAGDQFPQSVALTRDFTYFGSPFNDDNGANSGSVYSYSLTPVVTEGLYHGTPVQTSPRGSVTGTLVGTLNVKDADLNNPDTIDTFTFSLSDDAGGRFRVVGDQLQVNDASLLDYSVANTHEVIVRVTDTGGQSYEETFKVLLLNTNEAPIANEVIYSTGEDLALNDVLSATDVNSDDLTFEIVDQPTRGTATINNSTTGAFTYTPYSEVNGTDSFLFAVSDGQDYSNVATATINVTPVNDAPLAAAMAAESELAGQAGSTNDRYGAAVSLSGTSAIVGAQGDDAEGVDAGAAYLLARGNDGLWAEHKIFGWGAVDGDFVGASVAISGDYALVGAPLDDWGGSVDAGSVHVFERNDETWPQVIQLQANDSAALDGFGTSVYVAAERAIVGAPGDDDQGDGSGSVYIYERDSVNGWLETQKLLAADGSAGAAFGQAVAISGDYAIIGAYADDEKGPRSGSAYIYKRDTDGVWAEAQKLTATDGIVGAAFGLSVSIAGNRAVVGAPFHSDNGIVTAGAAYVFERSGDGVWSQVEKLQFSGSGSGEFFGSSVSISGDDIVVGAQNDDEKGAAYLFRRQADGSWNEVQKFVIAGGAVGDMLGAAVAISGQTVLAGAPGADGATVDSGSTYLFEFGHSVAEGTPIDTNIGTLSGLDIDDGESFTFQLLNDAGGRFNLSGNQLLVANSSLLDYESAVSHDILVRVSDSEGQSTDQTITVFLLDRDDTPPTLNANNTLTLNEGATGAISTSKLSATDIDTSDPIWAFTVTAGPSNGQLENTDSPGTPIASFTQQNLIDNKIQYVHDGSNTTSDSFTFKVSDGSNELTGQTFSIIVNAVDDDTPTIDPNNGLTLNEGATGLITDTKLSATDTDTDDTTLTYTVTTSPNNGQLENTDNSGVAISSFTQQNLIDNKIQYVHNGSNTTSDSFTFKVSDGSNELTGQTFSIIVNAVDDDTPTIDPNNGLTLNEGATGAITTTELSATDTDTGDTTLTYTVTTSPNNGQLENADNSGVAISSFTQQNLIDNKIQYVHNGSNTTSDSFTFKVSDGSNDLTGQTFNITVNSIDNDAPTISANTGLTLDEGATGAIPTSKLSAADTEASDSTLTFTVTAGLSNGQLENTDSPGTPITSFIQQNLIDGKIQYVHAGGNNTSDSFTFNVSDGTNELTGQIFSVSINAVNDLPTFTSLAPPTVATEDVTYSITVTADDDDNDPLTMSAPVLPGWLTFTPGTGLLEGTPAYADVGNHNVTLRVNDGTVDVDDSFVISVAFTDVDGDGLPDTWETNNGLDPVVNNSGSDNDGDGLLNGAEFTAGTDPANPDSDGDGLSDFLEETSSRYDPNTNNGTLPDGDSDGLPDAYENTFGVDLGNNPTDDYDNDGLSDRHEYLLGLDPTVDDRPFADINSNGIPDAIEAMTGLSPFDACADPDNDGIASNIELANGTSPVIDNTLLVDSDGDGVPDLVEWLAGLDDLLAYENGSLVVSPIAIDTDGDSLIASSEICLGTFPDDSDSDDDGAGPGSVAGNDANDMFPMDATRICTGDINMNGTVEVVDAMLALRMSVGLDPEDLLYGDVAPMLGGLPNPDSQINAADAMLILRKALGLVNW